MAALFALCAVVLTLVAYKVPKGDATDALRVWSAVIAIFAFGTGPGLVIAALALRAASPWRWAVQLLPPFIAWMLSRALL